MTRHLSEAERRAQILVAARETFVSTGYLASRVEDVAARARLSKGAVYFYFKSKRELFDALVAEDVALMMAFLDAAARDPRPPLVRLVELGTSYLRHFGGLATPPSFFLIMNEMAIRDEAVRASMSETHQRFLERIAELIREGVADGSFRDVDPLAAALVLKAMVDGMAGQSAIGIPLDVGRLSGDGIRLILEGLSAAPSARSPEGGPP